MRYLLRYLSHLMKKKLQQNGMCAKRKLGSAWTSAQSDQSSLCAEWHYENMLISNIQKTSPPKTENFQIKTDIFHVSAQNIDCGYSLEPPRKNIDCGYSLEPPRRGGSNEYPQSMCFSRNKKNNAYPCKPQFYYIKVGFSGIKII